MKTWKKKCILKKAFRYSLISFELADRILRHYYLYGFYAKYEQKILKREGVLKCHS